MREKITRKHPSYGVTTVHRATGDFEHLFQSSVGGNTGICLEIHAADVTDSGLGDDHVMARKELIEVHFSPLQWAEVISSINLGAGTPCTIHRLHGEMIEEPPVEEAVAHRTARQYAEELEELGTFSRKAEKRIDDILAKGAKMKAEDRAALREIFCKLTKAVKDSGPFMVKQTEQALNRMVEEAKATITDHAAHLRVSVGAVTVPMLGGEVIAAENYLEQSRAAAVVPGGGEFAEKPELPDLGPREKDLKPPEEYTREELAESISQHLYRIEKEDRTARMAQYETEDERCQDKKGAEPGNLYCAGASAGSTKKNAVDISYVAYHGRSSLSFSEAVTYLRALRKGYRGRHYAHEIEKWAGKEGKL